MEKSITMITRREALKQTAAMMAVAATLPTTFSLQAQTAAAPPAGPYTLPPLPYPVDALEPHIDAKTMEIHHGKHHAAYVNNLNKALADFPEFGKKSIEDLVADQNTLPEKVRTAVRNNGGGHLNHSLFWQLMKKDGGGEPQGELAKAIDATFGSFSGFKDKFTEASTKVFGSGWAWLVLSGKALKIESLPNQDAPLATGLQPILGLDVWEHAYYLKYQNRRPEYIAAWFKVINWDFASERFNKLRA
jgi:Fe-Mn family superoxide dismutase